jgi:UDP-N-acetylglucosamine pyrophosphorylase
MSFFGFINIVLISLSCVTLIQDQPPKSPLINRYLNEKAKGHKLDWNEVKSPSSETIPLYNSLPNPDSEQAKNALSKLAVLKLNGGLGTTMVYYILDFYCE